MPKIPPKVHRYLQPALRLGLGVLFFWSGIGKLQHFNDFLQAVYAYNILPVTLAKIYAQMLPWVEIMAAVYLILGLFTRFSAGLINLMMLSFIIAISAVLLRGDSLEDCGCFIGGQSEPLTPKKLVEDFFLLLAGVYLMLTPPGPWSLDNVLWKKPTPAAPETSPEEK